jgi:hypothetical protein
VKDLMHDFITLMRARGGREVASVAVQRNHHLLVRHEWHWPVIRPRYAYQDNEISIKLRETSTRSFMKTQGSRHRVEANVFGNSKDRIMPIMYDLAAEDLIEMPPGKVFKLIQEARI